jgi:metallophosphoesterase (TIGR00282 family)
VRFLIFGDVVGRAGREAVTRTLPDLRKEYQPDSIIINIENIAHGSGLSHQTVQEALTWQADVYTTGDHAWDNKQGIDSLEDSRLPIIRPVNYPVGTPGRGYHIYSNGAYRVAVINLQGQVFMHNHPLNPFGELDRLLDQSPIREANIVLVDFHAEATSEKRALGWQADGRISALWGTHTHVPTADAQILPQGTGYISDVGMNGAYYSIIGVDPAGPLKTFRQQIPARFSPVTEGPLEMNTLFLEIDPRTKKTTSIAHIRKILNDR